MTPTVRGNLWHLALIVIVSTTSSVTVATLTHDTPALAAGVTLSRGCQPTDEAGDGLSILIVLLPICRLGSAMIQYGRYLCLG